MAKNWNQPICGECYAIEQPGRRPHALVDAYRENETCCMCGDPTREGIYIRRDPAECFYPSDGL